MNYTLNQLQIFLKITQTLSITKAAEELHLTQPAVSIQLKNFQSLFEIPLTEVVGRKLYVTDFGWEIAEAAENILNQVNDINHKTLAYKGQLVGRMKISVVSTGKYVMPYFLADFINQNPGVELSLDVTNKQSVVQSQLENEVDFSLVSVIPDTLNVEKLDLLPNKLFLVGNSEQTLKKTKNPKEVLKDLPLIFREQGSGTRVTMERFLKQKKIPVFKKLELTSNEAVKQAVLSGMGFSIIPLIGLRNELMNGALQIVPLTGFPIQTTWSLIWQKGKQHSPVVKAFLEYLGKERETIREKKFSWYEEY